MKKMNCMQINTEKIKEDLKKVLSEKRYIHTLGVEKKAIELAVLYNENKDDASIAGLLHDCAKCLTNEELLEIIKENIKDVDECELLNYKTLHAPVSAYFAKENYKITDKKILDAIRWHTLGRINMTTFEKIIFLADKIEENRPIEYRNKIEPFLKEKNGLNKALLICFKETIKSLVDRDLKICNQTIDVYNELLQNVQENK